MVIACPIHRGFLKCISVSEAGRWVGSFLETRTGRVGGGGGGGDRGVIGNRSIRVNQACQACRRLLQEPQMALLLTTTGGWLHTYCLNP